MSTARDYRPAVERGPDLAERETQRFDRAPAAGLERRLAELPDGHPSAARYVDGRGRPDEVRRPLTDAEHAEHIKEVEVKLDEARAAGLATHVQYTIDSANEFWSDEREQIHDEIVEYLYTCAANVPCEGLAIVTGGLAGAGKTSVLNEHAGIDRVRYLMINPDLIKEELANRGLIPEVEGLSPMEASDLVHEESSHVARRLATRAYADRRNLIWDITMSKTATTEKRIEELRGSGYSQIEGVFVDIPIDVSLRRAESRHREDHDRYRSGDGYGGRYIAPSLILDQVDAQWGSQNRWTFEQTKDRFDSWSVFDNSVDGRSPVLTAALRPDE